MRYNFYTRREERLNALSHGLGLVLGAVAAGLLLARAWRLGPALWVWAVALYAVGMLASYLCSTLYHALPPASRGKERLRQCDHAAIYWHIAGSYSPVALVALLGQGAWGRTLFVAQWACALVGTACSFRRMERHSHFETLCFCVMGLSGVVALVPLAQATSWATVGWIVAEGVCYLTGAVFYSLRRGRYLHTVFHLWVLAGSACHVVAVWRMLGEATPIP